MRGKKRVILILGAAAILLGALLLQKLFPSQGGGTTRAGSSAQTGVSARAEVSAQNSVISQTVAISGDKNIQTIPEIQRETEVPEKKKVALTFDDGPHPSFTEKLLDGLKERGVHVTFFVTGEHAELHPDIILRMSEEGHLIGNHTYSHIQLKSDNLEEYKQELIRTNEVIQKITGEAPYFVRPPYGTWDKSLEEDLDMFPVLWSVDPRDWCNSNADCVAYLVERETKENDIILLHDYFQSSVQAALEIVDELLDEGYTFVTVDEILFD